jgi:hypothetical protein
MRDLVTGPCRSYSRAPADVGSSRKNRHLVMMLHDHSDWHRRDGSGALPAGGGARFTVIGVRRSMGKDRRQVAARSRADECVAGKA